MTIARYSIPIQQTKKNTLEISWRIAKSHENLAKSNNQSNYSWIVSTSNIIYQIFIYKKSGKICSYSNKKSAQICLQKTDPTRPGHRHTIDLGQCWSFGCHNYDELTVKSLRRTLYFRSPVYRVIWTIIYIFHQAIYSSKIYVIMLWKYNINI